MKIEWLCVSVLVLLFLVVPVASQDYPGQVNHGPFYLEGRIFRENNEIASGVVYLWHDANENLVVDFDDWEFETVTLNEDGIYRSRSQYGAGLPVILQTHTDGDYVSTYEVTIPTDIIHESDIVKLPTHRVRQRDPDPRIEIIYHDGSDMLNDNITITPALQLYISFFADYGLAIGQQEYFDLWAQQELLPWSLAVYVDGPTLNLLSRDYDYTIQTPTGLYYYYSMECVDWTADGQGGHYSFTTEWEILGDVNVTFQVYDPMWYLGGMPFSRLPQGPTINIKDLKTTVQGTVEWIHKPAPVGNCIGGEIFYSYGEPGAVVPDDSPILDIDFGELLYSLCAQYPYPIPMIAITYFLFFTRSGPRLGKLVSGSRRRRKRPPRLISKQYLQDESLTKAGLLISKAIGPPSAGRSVFRLSDFADPEVTKILPAEPVEDVATIDAVVATDNGTPTWVPECGECGDPLDDPEMIKHSFKLGAYWKCVSCGALNVIRSED